MRGTALSLDSPHRGRARVKSRPAHSPVRPSSGPLLLGVGASIAVLILRYAKVLVGPWAIGLGVLIVLFAPGPRRVSERFILVFALVFGWLPLLGWVPGIGSAIDVPGFVLAFGVGVVCTYQVRLYGNRARTILAPVVSEYVAFIIGIGVALWWGLPFSRLGLSGRLQYLFNGWDNNSHFAIFEGNLQQGSFLLVRPHLSTGSTVVGYDYPQGMHQAWAELARLWSPHPPMSTAWLLNAYSTLILLTTGSILIVGCMAISRVIRRDLLAGLPAMAVVVALFGVGRFGPFNGFPNYELAICAAAVGVTLLVHPTLIPKYNFFAIAGMGLIVVYNWYLLVILLAPALVVAGIEARGACLRGERRIVTGLLMATALALVAPALFFLHRGISSLNSTGGVVTAPWGLLTISIGALITVALVGNVLNARWKTSLVVGAPAVLGGAFVTLLCTYEVWSAGSVSYYGQKFAASVFAICSLVLVSVLAYHVAPARKRRVFSKPLAATLALVATFAALQIDGFVGPSANRLNDPYEATGLVAHNSLTATPHQSRDAAQLVMAAQIARREQSKLPSGTSHWWYLDLTAVPGASGIHVIAGSFARSAEWFAVLQGQPTINEYNRIVVLNQVLWGPWPLSKEVALIIELFPNPESAGVHFFVPTWLRNAIVQQDSAWRRPGVLLTFPMSDGGSGAASLLSSPR